MMGPPLLVTPDLTMGSLFLSAFPPGHDSPDRRAQPSCLDNPPPFAKLPVDNKVRNSFCSVSARVPFTRRSVCTVGRVREHPGDMKWFQLHLCLEEAGIYTIKGATNVLLTIRDWGYFFFARPGAV